MPGAESVVVTTREIAYDADGPRMVGHFARPAGTGPWPAVLIGHDGVGLNDYQRRRADHLAEQGYAAPAMDHHGGRWFSDPREMLGAVLLGLGSEDPIQAPEPLRVFTRELRDAGVDRRLNVYETTGTRLGRAGENHRRDRDTGRAHG